MILCVNFHAELAYLLKNLKTLNTLPSFFQDTTGHIGVLEHK